jgi:hypothetical protein
MLKLEEKNDCFVGASPPFSKRARRRTYSNAAKQNVVKNLTEKISLTYHLWFLFPQHKVSAQKLPDGSLVNLIRES